MVRELDQLLEINHMADKKRPPLPKFNTPVGVARYPHLNNPDTRFDADGVYKCDLIVKFNKAAKELIKYLEGIRDKRFKAEKKDAKKGKKFTKADVYSMELDDAGDETGNIILKTKLDAIGRNKDKGKEWKNSPKLFDSTGEPLASDVQIWSGSKLIIAGTVNSYAMTNKVLVEKDGKTTEKKITSVGVSLKCKGVQVLELVTGGDATAESFGFGQHEDGYQTEASKAGLKSEETRAEEEGEGGDEDEF